MNFYSTIFTQNDRPKEEKKSRMIFLAEGGEMKKEQEGKRRKRQRKMGKDRRHKKQ